MNYIYATISILNNTKGDQENTNNTSNTLQKA